MIVEGIMQSEQKLIRVLYVDRISKIAFTIEMEENKWPKAILLKQLQDEYKQVTKESSLMKEHFLIIKDDDLSDSEQSKRNFAYDVVEFLLKEIPEPLIYDHRKRLEGIRKVEGIFNISQKTIKKYLISYWKGGKTQNALLPNYRKCGGKGKEKQLGNKKIGRPRGELGEGVNVTNQMKPILSKGLNKYYYTSKQNSLRTAYELMVKEYFTEKVIQKDGLKIPIIKDIDNIPSYQQFLYWYRKNNNIKKEVASRQSTKEYYQLNRPIIGRSEEDGELGPGTLYQIDSTIFDCYLVSAMDRNLIVGRPVFYSVMDVYSRMIVGINVTFEAFNSYIGGMVALENTMTEKVSYCKRYGIEIKEGEWPIYYIPQRILADRGELEGKQIEAAIRNMGITIQNAPPFRGDLKGIIEASFRNMNLLVKPHIDGVVTNSKNLVERGEKDYRLNANMTLYEFTQIIIKCVLFHNNHHMLSHYVTNEIQLQDSIEKVPIHLWNHGVKNLKGILRVLSEEFIKTSLLPEGSATITAKGVVFKKMVYLSETILKSSLLTEARTLGNKRIKVSYDPRDASYVYLVNKEDNTLKKLTLVDTYLKYRGLSEIEIKVLREQETLLEQESKGKELQAKMNLIEDIQQIVKKSKQEMNKVKKTSVTKTEKLKGIKDNLQEERKIEREQDRIRKEQDNGIAESSIEDYLDDELELFKQLQEKGQY